MTTRQVIERGEWLYDGAVMMPATIVALDYDFWYEIGKANDRLEPGDVPELNSEGRLYYVCFKSDPETHPGWVDSQGFADVSAAKTWAAAQVPTPIRWLSGDAV